MPQNTSILSVSANTQPNNLAAYMEKVTLLCHGYAMAVVENWLYHPRDIFNGEDYDQVTHRIHGAAIYGNMDPINIPPMLAYIPYMDPMG